MFSIIHPLHLVSFTGLRLVILRVTPTDVAGSAHSRWDAELRQDNQLKKQPDRYHPDQPNQIFHRPYCAIGRPADFHASSTYRKEVARAR